jgi:hypothetical protein
MLDAPTLEDRTRPALPDVGRVPIRNHFTEHDVSFGLALVSTGSTSRVDRLRLARRARIERRTRVRPRSMVS